MTDQAPTGAQDSHASYADGFDTNQTTRAGPPMDEHTPPDNITSADQYLADFSITFLAATPVLQSSSTEAVRDTELIKLIVDCPEEKLLLIGNAVLGSVRRRILSLNMNVLEKIIDKFGDILTWYSHSQHAPLQILAVNLLDSTSHIWLQKSIMDTEIGDKMRQLCGWLARNMMKKKFVSWKVRDFVSQFLARYIAQEPSESFWPKEHTDKPVDPPSIMIPMLNMDEDIRVRFRASVVNARLFTLARFAHWNPLDMYNTIKEGLTKDLSK